MTHLLRFLFFLHLVAAAVIQPSDAACRRNAFAIFNAVHSAMRQWGSSLNHNGMSFFLATVPEGQLLYHGGPDSGRATGFNGKGFDWLAFEKEHAQAFAQSRVSTEDEDQVKDEPKALAYARPSSQQQPLLPSPSWLEPRHHSSRPSPYGRHYLHTYRANRPLRLILIDGMSAGKVEFGCLDLQDFVLLDWPTDRDPGHMMRKELERAEALCQLAATWSVDGFIRDEAGFEIIYCNLTDAAAGLDLASIEPTPFANETGHVRADIFNGEFYRAVTLRYTGFPAGRVYIDSSTMVSAFFYDWNLANPDPDAVARPERLPRLLHTTHSERRKLRDRLGEVVAARWGGSDVKSAVFSTAAPSWQGIVDMIVMRFSSRLPLLAAPGVPPQKLLRRADNMLSALLPFGTSHSACVRQYLLPALATQSSWTPEDRAVYVAVETVMQTICLTLRETSTILQGIVKAAAHHGIDETDKSDKPDERDETEAAAAIQKTTEQLMVQLQWTTWKECTPCPGENEICMVAMFPWGELEDHLHPSCVPVDDMPRRNGYWW